MRDAGLRQGMRDLSAHATDGLVIFDRHHAAGAVLDLRAYSVEINAVYERVVDDGRPDVLFRQFPACLDGFAQQWTATDENHIAPPLQHLCPAPLIPGALDPREWIILASDKENIGFAIVTSRPVRRITLDGLVHERFRFVRTGWRDHDGVRNRAGGGKISRRLMRRAVGGVLKPHV